MTSARDMRRCALQALYQFDAGNHESPELVRGSLDASAGDANTHNQGFELAEAAWTMRSEADAEVTTLAPDWPTNRQPVVDRSILRLAYYEIVSGRTPPKVVSNEAVEHARECRTDRSPMFINGVLDKIYKSRRDDEAEAPNDADADADAASAT